VLFVIAGRLAAPAQSGLPYPGRSFAWRVWALPMQVKGSAHEVQRRRNQAPGAAGHEHSSWQRSVAASGTCLQRAHAERSDAEHVVEES